MSTPTTTVQIELPKPPYPSPGWTPANVVARLVDAYNKLCPTYNGLLVTCSYFSATISYGFSAINPPTQVTAAAALTAATTAAGSTTGLTP